jgi:hypothetical protein
MVGKNERLALAIEELKKRGLVHKQQDVADKMGVNKSNLSKALKGEVSGGFLRRFNSCFGGIFSDEWLASGSGSMLVPSISQSVNGDGNTSVAGNGNHVNVETSRFLDELAAQRRLTEEVVAQNGRLLSIIEKMQG